MSNEYILVDQPAEGVGRVRLNRPKALNALSSPLMDEVNEAMLAFNSDPSIGAMILTGDDKAFAAGADIKEMDGMTPDRHADEGHADRAFRNPAAEQAGHRRRFRLCAGRRLRNRHGLRYDCRVGDGALRAARDQPGHHPPAPAARNA